MSCQLSEGNRRPCSAYPWFPRYNASLSFPTDFANGLVNCQTVTGDTVLHILASEDSTAKLLRTIVKLTKPNLRLRDSQVRHLDNMPMQYTAIVDGWENDNFQLKNFDVFA